MRPEPTHRKPTAILFVCLGNICRSALAEGILRNLAAHKGRDVGLVIDSAGTGSWHVGKPPDPRAIATAREHGIDIAGQRGRQVTPADFQRFDLMLAMDRSNLETLLAWAPVSCHADIRMFMSYATDRDMDVPDPYYGGPEGFEQVYRMIEAAGTALMGQLSDR